MWDNRDGCENQYSCAPGIYLLSCNDFELYIIIDISVGEPVCVKYVVDGMNSRDKRILKLAMLKLLSLKLIKDNSSNFKVMYVHENKEDQAVSLSK